MKRLSPRYLDPLDGESSHHLEVAVPGCKVLASCVSAQGVKRMVFLNGKDIWALHIDAVEVDLRNIASGGERNGGVTIKAM